MIMMMMMSMMMMSMMMMMMMSMSMMMIIMMIIPLPRSLSKRKVSRISSSSYPKDAKNEGSQCLIIIEKSKSVYT